MAFHRKSTTSKFRRVAKKSGRSRSRRVFARRSNSIAKTVKRVLFRTAETKHAFSGLNPTNFNSYVSGLSDLYSIIPNIQQGAGNNARIGERISPSYLTLRGYVTANQSNTLTNGAEILDVDLFFLMDKVQRDGSVRDATSAKFIRQGGSVVMYDGTIASTCAPVDTDRFKVLKRIKCKLIPWPLATNQLNSNPNSGSQVYRFKVTVPMSRLCRSLDYSDISSSQPNNCNMFFTCGYARYNDPANQDNILAVPVQVSYSSTLYYKDI